MKIIYVATDIESDGNAPGLYSMLSFGSVAFTDDKKILGTFERNLELLPGADQAPSNMAFWDTEPVAYAETRKDTVPPKLAMQDYKEWLELFDGQLVFVAHPVAFDYAFISWYLYAFTGDDPFERRSLDIASYAAAVLKKPVTQTTAQSLPKEWFDQDYDHNHRAIDDARGYATLLCNIFEANK